MSNTSDFINYVSELLAVAGRVTTRRMFGGHGVYLDGMFMAIVVDDELYLKADDMTRAAFDAESCAPFVFAKDGKQMSTHYRRAPDEAMDAPHLILPWARLALAAALRTRAQKVKPTPKKKTAAKAKPSRPAKKRT